MRRRSREPRDRARGCRRRALTQRPYADVEPNRSFFALSPADGAVDRAGPLGSGSQFESCLGRQPTSCNASRFPDARSRGLGARRPVRRTQADRASRPAERTHRRRVSVPLARLEFLGDDGLLPHRSLPTPRGAGVADPRRGHVERPGGFFGEQRLRLLAILRRRNGGEADPARQGHGARCIGRRCTATARAWICRPPRI